jgi:MerR family transcriptional regulator, copper efflux regulator
MKISEVAERTGVPSKTIRYYEEIRLIEPAARSGNRYRAYGDKDVATLRFISRARALGFPLKDVAALLDLYRDRGRASREVKRLATKQIAELDRKIAELMAIRGALADLAERCHGDDRPDCPIIEELGAITH